MNASTPHINRALALGRITLKLRYLSKDAAIRPGATIKGDREIWIDGEHWLNAVTSHHGRHGSRHELQYPGGGEVLVDANAKRPRSVIIASPKTRRRIAPAGVTVPDQYDAIKNTVLELLEAGRLEAPSARRQRHADAAAAYRAERDAEQARRTTMLQGIFSLRDRGDLTSAEREALAWLYKEAFADDMPAAEGATDGK